MSLETFDDITVHIKVEPVWEGDQDVADALRVLYAGHVVKEELVLGPELMRAADAFELQDSLKAENTHKQASLERTCSVNLERMFIDMKHRICRIGGKTYGFRISCLQNQGKAKSGKKIISRDRSAIKDEPVKKATKENQHKVKKLRGAKYFCNECQYSTKNSENLLAHLNTHDGKKPFKYSQWDSAFLCESRLNLHNLRKHSEKPFKCSLCSARFACKTLMITHLRIHSGVKPYKCNRCSAAFTQSGHLNRHLKTHNSLIDEKPFKCFKCTSKFKDRWSLIRHQGTHTGKRSYTCSECGAAFNQTGNLLRHQRIHTGEKRYKCSYCDAAFVQSCDLAKHIKIHSGKGPLECKVCVYKTNRMAALKSHIKKWHSGQKAKAKIEVIQRLLNCDYDVPCLLANI